MTDHDQLTFQNPVDRFPQISPPEQDQPEPGFDEDITPKADHGEESYRGTGRLEGRKALVTGADSGIGAAVAIAFAREGADVALNYLEVEEEDAQHIIETIRETGRKAVALPGDIRDKEFCTQLVEDAARELGGLDALVNNAGKQIIAEDLTELPDDQWEQTYKTNIQAMFWITKAALKHLPAGSTIVNTTSIQGYNPNPMLIDYASTKAAINNFSKGLGQQLAPKGDPRQCRSSRSDLDTNSAIRWPTEGKTAALWAEHSAGSRRSANRGGTRVCVSHLSRIELCDR